MYTRLSYRDIKALIHCARQENPHYKTFDVVIGGQYAFAFRPDLFIVIHRPNKTNPAPITIPLTALVKLVKAWPKQRKYEHTATVVNNTLVLSSGLEVPFALTETTPPPRFEKLLGGLSSCVFDDTHIDLNYAANLQPILKAYNAGTVQAYNTDRGIALFWEQQIRTKDACTHDRKVMLFTPHFVGVDHNHLTEFAQSFGLVVTDPLAKRRSLSEELNAVKHKLTQAEKDTQNRDKIIDKLHQKITGLREHATNLMAVAKKAVVDRNPDATRQVMTWRA